MLGDRAGHRALAQSPSINVIFLAFGEGSPAASLWALRVRLKGTSNELDETHGAKRPNSAGAELARSGARTQAAAAAASANAHATARDLVGSPARRRRTGWSGLRAADLGALYPPAIVRQIQKRRLPCHAISSNAAFPRASACRRTRKARRSAAPSLERTPRKASPGSTRISRPIAPRASASTTARIRTRSARPRSAPSSRSTRSPKCACSTRISSAPIADRLRPAAVHHDGGRFFLRRSRSARCRDRAQPRRPRSAHPGNGG